MWERELIILRKTSNIMKGDVCKTFQNYAVTPDIRIHVRCFYHAIHAHTCALVHTYTHLRKCIFQVVLQMQVIVACSELHPKWRRCVHHKHTQCVLLPVHASTSKPLLHSFKEASLQCVYCTYMYVTGKITAYKRDHLLQKDSRRLISPLQSFSAVSRGQEWLTHHQPWLDSI